METNFNDKTILLTGGTGSFGKKFTEIVLNNFNPKKLIIYSRDELKQFEMSQIFNQPNIRYFIGDVRDKERLYRAFKGVDIIVHAAALKQVPACEYNPFEAIKTNIMGAQNIIDAAIDNGVSKVLALSTDKATSPVNLYGATKLCAEKLFIAANNYSGDRKTKFSMIRYGNVVGSRGSVIPFFKQHKSKGYLPITDERMTRFWITLEQGVWFVLKSIERMEGYEIFIPKIPSMKITDLAEAIEPGIETRIIGIRQGEKIHEQLISENESSNTLVFSDYYIIVPSDKTEVFERIREKNGATLPPGFVYGSDTNTIWITISQLKKIVDEI